MLRRISVKVSACQFGSGFSLRTSDHESKIYNAESERYLLYRNAKSSFQMMEEEIIGNSTTISYLVMTLSREGRVPFSITQLGWSVKISIHDGFLFGSKLVH